MNGDRAIGDAVRRHATSITTLVAAAIAVGAMWGPWFASGSATRNSFGLFRAAQILGIEWVTPYRIAWFLLPIVLALAIVLVAYGATRSAMAVLICLGLVLGGAGALAVAGFGALWGALVAAAAGCCTVIAALAAIFASINGSATAPAAGRAPDAGTAPATGTAPTMSTEN